MATWDDWPLETSRLARENIPAVEEDLLVLAKEDLRLKLDPFLIQLVAKEGVTETEFYDQLVSDLDEPHDVGRTLQLLLSYAYLSLYYAGRYAAPGNVDWDRHMRYSAMLTQTVMRGLAAKIEQALKQRELVFTAEEVTRTRTPKRVVWTL